MTIQFIKKLDETPKKKSTFARDLIRLSAEGKLDPAEYGHPNSHALRRSIDEIRKIPDIAPEVLEDEPHLRSNVEATAQLLELQQELVTARQAAAAAATISWLGKRLEEVGEDPVVAYEPHSPRSKQRRVVRA